MKVNSAMANWRMSFRVGNQGYEMWPDCLRLGVAAITYAPLAKVDLSKHLPGAPKELWDRLEPTQKASLRRVAYEMRAGDIIYVKQGPSRFIERLRTTRSLPIRIDWQANKKFAFSPQWP
jgi:hypothetical protein